MKKYFSRELDNVVLAFIIAIVCTLGLVTIVHATPFFTGTQARLSVATTSQVSIAPGLATTTPIYDSYEVGGTNQTNSGTITLPDSVAILLGGRASSTNSVVNLTCEFSDNYSPVTGNGDWYQNEIFPATTTQTAMNIDTPVSYTFKYASTSSQIGGIAQGATSDRFQKLVQCPVPLRFVRAVISTTGATSTVWYAIIPKKQR